MESIIWICHNSWTTYDIISSTLNFFQHVRILTWRLRCSKQIKPSWTHSGDIEVLTRPKKERRHFDQVTLILEEDLDLSSQLITFSRIPRTRKPTDLLLWKKALLGSTSLPTVDKYILADYIVNINIKRLSSISTMLFYWTLIRHHSLTSEI